MKVFLGCEVLWVIFQTHILVIGETINKNVFSM